MSDASGRYHLVFNGEIYNYIELRDQLRSKGEIFATETDSEVLLRAYMVWGENCLAQLRGMFAFLIWDDRDKRLFAARDRFGIKPLYMAATPYGAAFASEIKQLLGLPGVSGRMNLPRVHDFLASGISDHTSETMFDGVIQLRGGECAVIDINRTGTLKTRIWRWYPLHTDRTTLSEGEAAVRFRNLLIDSVREHLRSDVPIGSCLSGGLDSSSIVCLMASMLNEQGRSARVNTVSACYAEKSVDEKPFMEAVVERTGANPHYVFPRPDDVFQRASDITWHQDEPFGSTSIFAQWCVFEEARRAGIKVMLDGQGADEQLAGYHASYTYYMSDLIRRGRVAMLLRTMWERRQYHGLPLSEQIARFVLPNLPTTVTRLIRQKRPTFAEHDWLGTEMIQKAGNPIGAVAAATAALGLPPVTDIASLCVTLTHASNLAMLLHFEDRNSMAHSIEARVPFLDHRLVEFSLALANDHKIVGGDTKRVLRRAMSGVLPKAVQNRRDKLGFSTPEEAWFRGPLRGMVLDGVETTLSRYPGLLDANSVRALAKDTITGHRPFDSALWRIISLGIWGERFGVSH